MEKICIDFGNFIREKRNHLGYSQAEVAKMLGISQSSYAKFETGTREANLSMVFELGKVLDFVAGDFFDSYRG